MQHSPNSQQSIEDEFDRIGCENLSDSGFEAEEPETDFIAFDQGQEE